jgi:hypothetical protein
VIFTVSNIAEEAPKRPGRKGRTPRPLPAPRVSDGTRHRLYAEASNHPTFDGMEQGDIKGFIDDRLEEFLAKQPFWYGHTGRHGGADTRHHAAIRQYEARRNEPRRYVRKDQGGEHVASAIDCEPPALPERIAA